MTAKTPSERVADILEAKRLLALADAVEQAARQWRETAAALVLPGEPPGASNGAGAHPPAVMSDPAPAPIARPQERRVSTEVLDRLVRAGRKRAGITLDVMMSATGWTKRPAPSTIAAIAQRRGYKAERIGDDVWRFDPADVADSR